MLESRQKVEIPLRTVAGLEHKKLASNIRQTIENEYAIKYLERIGVQPTKEKIEYMLSNMPIERALVVPVWTRSALVLVPERVEETDQNVIKQIYTGSKDIEISKRKGGSFFGKGVSEPGTNPHELKRSNTALSSKSRRKSSNIILYVEITYPYVTKIPLFEIKSTNFQQLIKPLAVSDSRLKMAIKSFCSSLSDYVPRIFDDTTGKMNVIIQKFLGCLLCRRLFGLLCHYAFWNIVHPFARQTLLTAKNQHIDAFRVSNQQQRTEQIDLATSAFARRKSMMTFTATNSDTLKKIVNITAPTTEITPKKIIKGGLILNRAVAMINANRALNGFGVNAIESNLQTGSPHIQTRSHHVAFQSDYHNNHHNNNHHDNNHHDNDLQTTSTNSVGMTLSSDASLTSEEKEILYCQLEECLNKLHTQMGFSRQALINARQGLVAGCHFIVNEILCAHYPWLGGKRDVIDVNNNPPIPSARLSPPSRPSTSETTEELSDSDLALIDALRESILKQINEVITDLLDPARVYCDKIMKEMFHENENTPKEIIDEKKKIHKESQIISSHQQHQHQFHHHQVHQQNHHHGRQNKYYATSIAVRAVFSSETNPETRKFLGMNTTAPYPLVQGKSKRKEKGDSVDAEPSQFSNLTPLTSSITSYKKGGYHDDDDNGDNDNDYNDDGLSLTHSPSEQSSPLKSPFQHTSTMRDFKTLFEHDLKEHPKSLVPKFNPKNSLLYRRSTKIEKSMNPDNSDNNSLNRGLSRGLSRSLSRLPSSQNLSKQLSMNSEFNDEASNTNESDSKQLTPEQQEQQQQLQQQISVNTKSKLMSLVVQRSKSKYTDKHLLQYARIPNAKYREELLQSGS